MRTRVRESAMFRALEAAMEPYVDLHAHFLPMLDDGARTAELGLQMVEALVALGFGVLHATPHQRAGMFMPTREEIDAQHGALSATATTRQPGLTVGLAAENYWDEVFHERLSHGGLPCYPGERAFLFEVNPQMMPPRIESTLFDIRVGGRLPVMAHPERYVAIQEDIARAEAIGRSAALVIDLGALDGAHGRPAMKTARKLLEAGLAHAAASDVHTPEDQRAVAGGMAWIRKRLGPPILEQLLAHNPRAILTGELP
jgi:protein-tyrosine phosphatase